MNQITIDCSLFSCRNDAHQALSQALAFPAYYGNNLDALHDCLTEIGTDTRIQLLHWEEAELQMESYGKLLKKVLDLCCQENTFLHIDYC